MACGIMFSAPQSKTIIAVQSVDRKKIELQLGRAEPLADRFAGVPEVRRTEAGS